MVQFRRWGFLLLGIGLSSNVFGAIYDIDVAHSNVGFKIKHLVTKVSGNFEQFSGTIEYDEKSPSKLKAEAIIQTSSIYTNEPKRDQHLKSPDFFNVQKYPTMVYKSQTSKVLSTDKVQLIGNLTLLGVTKSVPLEVELSSVVVDPWGGTRTGFSASGKLYRKDFGMVWNKILDNGGILVGDEVEIVIDIEAIRRK